MTHEHDLVDAPTQEQERAREDTEAILSRRAFLIHSALAGAGVAAGTAACEKSKQSAQAPDKPRPQICLKKRVPQPDASLRPCLSVGPTEEPPPPRPTGDPKAGMKDPTRVPMGRPCLGLRPPRKRKPDHKPMVCLSKPRPRPRKRSQKRRGSICLSLIE